MPDLNFYKDSEEIEGNWKENCWKDGDKEEFQGEWTAPLNSIHSIE